MSRLWCFSETFAKTDRKRPHSRGTKRCVSRHSLSLAHFFHFNLFCTLPLIHALRYSTDVLRNCGTQRLGKMFSEFSFLFRPHRIFAVGFTSVLQSFHFYHQVFPSLIHSSSLSGTNSVSAAGGCQHFTVCLFPFARTIYCEVIKSRRLSSSTFIVSRNIKRWLELLQGW